MTRNEISISDVFHALVGHIVLILISALVCGMAAFTITKAFIKPTYKTSITLYAVSNLNQDSGIITSSDQNASAQLATTYAQILKSTNVMSAVSEELEKKGLHYGSSQLKGMAVTSTTTTQVFNVTVTARSAVDAKTVADTIADVASDKIAKIVGGGEVRIVDYAQFPGAPSSPDVKGNTTIGVLIGLLIACLIVIIRLLTDTTIWSEEDVAKQYDIPILGTVPQLSSSEKQASAKEQP